LSAPSEDKSHSFGGLKECVWQLFSQLIDFAHIGWFMDAAREQRQGTCRDFGTQPTMTTAQTLDSSLANFHVNRQVFVFLLLLHFFFAYS
jgi:hypothetical protein